MNPFRILVTLFAVFVFLLAEPLWAQSAKEIPLAYRSPVPGALYVMPGTTITFRHGEPFSSNSVSRGLVEVTDPSAQRIEGELFLTKNRETLIFKPFLPFTEGETIQVTLHPGLELESGRKIKPEIYHFTITRKVIPVDYSFIEKYILEKDLYLKNPQSRIPENRAAVRKNNLPEGLAEPGVLIHNKPPEGHYFYAPHDPWSMFPDIEPYICIADAYGTLVYYKKMETPGYDIKIHRNGMLSYYTYHPEWGHVVMDSTFQAVDKFQMGNGYTYTDFHDFQLSDDGHGFVMTYDPQLVDMSQIVPGGNPEAIVMGFVMQELDEDKNVIFEWRSWDHFEITETGPEVDLTAEDIDYVHGNTVEVESDTSILISSRNMHEVTKIHRNSGEIIWRLGGSQNQFTFLGEDTLRFNRQHDSRRQPNGLISIFDNGTTRPEPQFSSIPEFQVNPEDSTATLVKRYRHDPDYYGAVMGNGYYTPDSTIVVGWGSCEPGITEIDPDGNVLFEMEFGAFSYRAYRFPWKTTYFTFGDDSLVLNYQQNSTVATGTLIVNNPQDHPISLTNYELREGQFEVADAFPKEVPSGDTVHLTILYYPEDKNSTEDVLTVHSEVDTSSLVQRISQQVRLVAHKTQGQNEGIFSSFDVRIYPNPVGGDVLMIEQRDPEQELKAVLFDITGVKIGEWDLLEGINNIRMDPIPAGIYTMHLKDQKNNRKVFKIVRR